MAEAAALVATLGADLNKFGDDMKRADDMATQSVKSIEDRFKAANPSFAQPLDRLRDDAVSRAEAVGGAIGTAIGVGLAAAVTLVVAKLKTIIGALAEIGDKSEDLRLPVNLLQALSVAGGQAGVSQEKLNSALDKFTEVSKKDEDGAKSFYKALGNINEASVDQFKNAKTQQERLLILSDAFKSTTDEVKRAQLSETAFGTDVERVTALLGAGRGGIQEYMDQVHRLGLEIDESAVKRAQQARGELSLLARVITDQLSSSFAGLIPVLQPLIVLFERMGAVARDVLAIFAASDAAKPVETLQTELATLSKQVEDLSGLRERMQSGELTPSESMRGKLRQFLGDELKVDLSESVADVDAQIVAIKRRIDEVQALIDRKQSTPTQVTVRPAFQPRPSLSDGGDNDTDAFTRQVDSINRHIAAVEADAEAVGLNAAEHARLRTEAALTEALLRAGIEINDEYAAKIDLVASRAAAAAATLDRARTTFQGVNDALKFGGNQLVDVLDRAMQKGAKFGDIMADVLHNVSRQLLQAAITGEGAFAKILGFASATPGGTGGILGALFSTSGKADGGPVSAGVPIRVGERGEEIFVPKTAGTILPNDVARNVGGGATSVTYAPNVTISGASTVTAEQLAQVLANERANLLPTIRSAIAHRQL